MSVLMNKFRSCLYPGFDDQDMERPSFTQPAQYPSVPLVVSKPDAQPVIQVRILIRDWSKSIEGGGLQRRGDGSRVFDLLVRSGSFNFQLPRECGSSYFITGIGTRVCQISLEKERHIYSTFL